MNYETEAKVVSEIFDRCLKTLVGKAHDYAQERDCFSNFKFIASTCKVPVDKTFLMFLAVKLARLSELIDKGGLSVFESIEDTLMDTINYAALYLSYLKTEEND